jgi:outer membrane protein assembly factor BamB
MIARHRASARAVGARRGIVVGPSRRGAGACALAAFVLAAASPSLARDSGWWGFRGDGRSVADEPLPLTWSVESGENVAWQADLPGRGVSGPIVVGDRVVVTCSSGANRDRLHVIAFDAGSGKQLWHRQFWAVGRTLVHETSAVAANTPASDGERIFAFFSSNDLYALDLDGNLLWMRGLTLNHPLAGNDIGMSSSPVVVGGVVVVQSEAHAASFVEAFDVRTGETRWSAERTRDATWCSPVAVRQTVAGEPTDAVLLQAGQGVELRRAAGGEVLWRLDLECETIPSAVAEDRIYVPSGGLRAIAWDGRTSAPEVVWQDAGLQPGSPSPVIYRGHAYVVNSAGVLARASVQDEKTDWKLRLGGRFWATPVAAGNHLYCINSEGKAFVVELGEKGRIVGETEFGEDILASPAVSNGALYVRSHGRLWKIAR